MVTEQEARDMNTAIEAFQNSDEQALRTQRQADVALAQTWYDTTIEPTLKWRSTQTARRQLANTFDDIDTLESLTPANNSRKNILIFEISKLRDRVRQIKAGL